MIVTSVFGLAFPGWDALSFICAVTGFTLSMIALHRVPYESKKRLFRLCVLSAALLAIPTYRTSEPVMRWFLFLLAMSTMMLPFTPDRKKNPEQKHNKGKLFRATIPN